MKRSSFLKRLLGVGIMATPAAKLLSVGFVANQEKTNTGLPTANKSKPYALNVICASGSNVSEFDVLECREYIKP
jgi:hypothetical protein